MSQCFLSHAHLSAFMLMAAYTYTTGLATATMYFFEKVECCLVYPTKCRSGGPSRLLKVPHECLGGVNCEDPIEYLEVVSCETDIRIRLSVKFGLRTLIWMPSANFRNGIWQNGQRIWIQHAKTCEMDCLFVFFGARMPKRAFRDKDYCSCCNTPNFSYSVPA